jgi:hypothetical protein
MAIDGFCRYVRPASVSCDGGYGLRYWIIVLADLSSLFIRIYNFVTLMIFCICPVRELQEPTGTAERIGMRPDRAPGTGHSHAGP